MTVRIYYDTPDGVDMVERGERVYNDGVVSAYDNPRNKAGVFRKVEIPTDRVIQVTHDEQEWSE